MCYLEPTEDVGSKTPDFIDDQSAVVSQSSPEQSTNEHPEDIVSTADSASTSIADSTGTSQTTPATNVITTAASVMTTTIDSIDTTASLIIPANITTSNDNSQSADNSEPTNVSVDITEPMTSTGMSTIEKKSTKYEPPDYSTKAKVGDLFSSIRLVVSLALINNVFGLYKRSVLMEYVGVFKQLLKIWIT